MVGQLTSKARNTKDFWAQIAEAIRPYEYDFPVAVLYSQCELHEPTDAAGALKGPLDRCTLEWSIGYRPNHPDVPRELDLSSDLGLARALSDSTNEGAARIYREEDGVLPASMYKDLEKRGFGDPLKVFLVVPIRTYDNTVVGYLLIGLNTRRPYDHEYRDWIEVFSNLLGASAASVALHEEEAQNRERQKEQADRDREALNVEVANLTQEASHVAKKLRNFHDIADQVGLGYFEIDVNGLLVHANVSIRISDIRHVLTVQQETYFTQTGHRRDFAYGPPFSYKERVHEDDIPMVEKQWETLVAGHPATF